MRPGTRTSDQRAAGGAALSRRGFLAGTTVAGLAAGGLGTLLTGCDSTSGHALLLKQDKPPAPNNPVTWPIYRDNQAIPSGDLFAPDSTISVLAWNDRLADRCVRDFAKKYGCQVDLTTFSSMPEAMARLNSRHARFDVFLGATLDVLDALVAGKVIQPLNHSYIPNIIQTWQMFTDPFYDQDWRYTAPYTVYTTGIGWRRDLISVEPYADLDAWQLLWQPSLEGKTAILDDYREVISLGLLKNGEISLDTANPQLVDASRRALLSMVSQTRPLRSNQAYLGLASGDLAIGQVWSGQIAAAGRLLPPGVRAENLGYWFPSNGLGPVANDMMVVPRSSADPLLAHLFINFMLDRPNALHNAISTGFTQPLTWMTPERMIKFGAISESLISAAVLENDFYRGLKELQLQVGARALWQQAWRAVVRALR